MRVQKFRARAMPEAVEMIRRTMGQEAVILHTRRVRGPGLLGWLRRSWVEVLAAVDEPAVSRGPLFTPAATGPAVPPVTIHKPPAMPPEATTAAAAAAPAPATMPAPAGVTPRATQGTAPSTRPRRRLTTLEAGIPGSAGAPVAPDGLWERLVAAGLSQQAASTWIEQAAAMGDTTVAGLGTALRGLCFPPEPLGPQSRRVVALVGPTGAGKTTTAAKLAARAVLEGRRAAFITADTFRVHGAEQVQAYAGILGIPALVAGSPAEMTRAMQDLSGVELVVIDTAGHNHRDIRAMAALTSLLVAAQPDMTLLVLAAPTDREELLSQCRSYDRVNFTGFCFTKLDEASRYGGLLDVLFTVRRPVHYFGTGQDVPEDLELADAQWLLKRVWPGGDGA